MRRSSSTVPHRQASQRSRRSGFDEPSTEPSGTGKLGLVGTKRMGYATQSPPPLTLGRPSVTRRATSRLPGVALKEAYGPVNTRATSAPHGIIRRWYSWRSALRSTDEAKGSHGFAPGIENVLAISVTESLTQPANSELQDPMDPLHQLVLRNRQNFKTAIYFHCGGLDLYPSTRSISALPTAPSSHCAPMPRVLSASNRRLRKSIDHQLINCGQ